MRPRFNMPAGSKTCLSERCRRSTGAGSGAKTSSSPIAPRKSVAEPPVAIAMARGAESVFRGSLFRASYEIFYTPIPSREKRAAKSLIDVGFDRLGDAAGGGLVRSIASNAATSFS